MRKHLALVAGIGVAAVVAALIASQPLRSDESSARESGTGGSAEGVSAPATNAADALRTRAQAVLRANEKSALNAPGAANSAGARADLNDASSTQAPASISDGQQPQGRSEFEVLKLSLNSDYDSHDKATLLALAKSGDVVALYKLFGQASARQLCELAGVSYRNGFPMAYGLAMDVVMDSTRDRTLARAYFYAWLHSGSDLAKKLESESLRRTEIPPEQDQRALALSQQLQANNDCSWAPGS